MDTNTSALASIGIDIGKEVFHIVGFGTNGKIGIPAMPTLARTAPHSRQ
jgi:hypothetical protein